MRKASFFLIAIISYIYRIDAQNITEVVIAKDELFTQNQDHFSTAEDNARLMNESFRRVQDYLEGWLLLADKKSLLIPRKYGQHFWNIKDAAADNYPFMVLTSYFVNQEKFNGIMKQMLQKEIALTSRIGNLPDDFDFKTQEFRKSKAELDHILFGCSEYIKDGLLPLTEWLGQSPWYDRMVDILDDMWKYAPIETPYGKIVSKNVEVNGEMLQVLSRLYWTTGKKEYLEYAIRIGDYYLLGKQHPTRDFMYLQLRDHGCEIISGLTELYATVSVALPDKKEIYQAPMHEMLDCILKTGRNTHGLFYDAISPKLGIILIPHLADTWGYTLNGFYTVYLIDKKESYREAAIKAMSNLYEHYRNHRWEFNKADGYADAIESALNLLNREFIPSTKEWIDSEIKVMWGKQDNDRAKHKGRIESWYGDGNFARTSIMYALWKTKGLRIDNWREDLQIGAEMKENRLFIVIKAKKDWKGNIYFDHQRSKEIMKLPFDWPRINQFPEWYTVKKGSQYNVMLQTEAKKEKWSAEKLMEGLTINIQGGKIFKIIVEPETN